MSLIACLITHVITCRFLAKVWGKTGSKLYGPKSGADYLDNHKRFTLFCKAAIEACRALPFGPGEDCVIVANDWHSALIPVMIKVQDQTSGWPAVLHSSRPVNSVGRMVVA